MNIQRFWKSFFGYENGDLVRTIKPIKHWRGWAVPVGTEGTVAYGIKRKDGDVDYFILLEASIPFVDKPQTFEASKDEIEPVVD